MADLYGHLSDEERYQLAVHARAIAGMYGSKRLNPGARRLARRWGEIADGLHAKQHADNPPTPRGERQ